MRVERILGVVDFDKNTLRRWIGIRFREVLLPELSDALSVI